MNKLKLPSPATVIALIALTVALSGTAYAVKKIGTKQLANNAVKTKKIANNAVTEPKIKDGSVSQSKLAADGRIAWALIDGSTNAILAQSGGISIAAGSGGGAYFVKFPVQLPGRALAATLHAAQSGEIAAGICGAPAPTVGEVLFCNTTNPSDNSTSTARVETSGSGGASSARRFYIAVLPK